MKTETQDHCYKIGPRAYVPRAWVNLPINSITDAGLHTEFVESNDQSLVVKVAFKDHIFLIREDKLLESEGIEVSVHNSIDSVEPILYFVQYIGGSPNDVDIYSTKEAIKSGHVVDQSDIQKDDLKIIHGIGPASEKLLNSLGITTFNQLASFSQSDIDEVAKAIGIFPGRIKRDDWIGGALEQLRKEKR